MSWKPTHPRHYVILPITFTICFNVAPLYYGSREFLAARNTWCSPPSQTWLPVTVSVCLRACIHVFVCSKILNGVEPLRPITVAARSKAWTVLARSNTGIVGSKPTQGMDVCLHFFCVCVGSGLATGWSPVQGVLQRFTMSYAAKCEQ
jgi:hypothetical protein